MRSCACVRSGLSTRIMRRPRRPSVVVADILDDVVRRGRRAECARSGAATMRAAVASSMSPARPITRLFATTSRFHSSAAARALDPLERRLGAERRAAVRMARAAQPVEPARRERAVVVADLVEDLRRLAQEARVLVLGRTAARRGCRRRDRSPHRGGATAQRPEIVTASRLTADVERRRRASRASRRGPRDRACRRRGARAARRGDADLRCRSDRRPRRRGSRCRTRRAACRATPRR